MIILPLEDRKPSRLLTWVFRILFTVVIFSCLILFVLNMLSGNTESHRKGLEQAMADVFKGTVTIGELKTFNLFPQFLIEMENVKGTRAEGDFSIGALTLGFSLSDIILKRQTVETVIINDLVFAPGIAGPQELRVTAAAIVPATDTKAPEFHMQGSYGSMPFDANFGIEQVAGTGRPSYRVGDANPVSITSGDFLLKGQYVQTPEGFPSITEAALTLQGKPVATGSISIVKHDKQSRLQSDFKSGSSQGRVSASFHENDKNWDFDVLDVSDIVGPAAIWHEVASAWRDTARPVSKPVSEDGATGTLAITVKKLQGGFAGSDLKGRFVTTPDHLTGWWTGQLQLPAQPQSEATSPDVKCALVDLVRADDELKAPVIPLYTGPETINAELSFQPYTGVVTAAVRQIAQGAALFGLNTEAFVAHEAALGLNDAPACLDLLGRKN